MGRILPAGESHRYPGLDEHLEYAELVFGDNGIGFEQQYADRMFMIFQRLPGPGKYEGTGIGLALVRKIVANHRGFIRAEGKKGEGATFTLVLPVKL